MAQATGRRPQRLIVAQTVANTGCMRLDAGWVGPYDAPGLGVTINEVTLERYGVA